MDGRLSSRISSGLQKRRLLWGTFTYDVRKILGVLVPLSLPLSHSRKPMLFSQPPPQVRTSNVNVPLPARMSSLYL